MLDLMYSVTFDVFIKVLEGLLTLDPNTFQSFFMSTLSCDYSVLINKH